MKVKRKNTGQDRFTEAELRNMTSRWLSPERVPVRLRIFTDTSDFFGIDYDDVVILDGKPYLVRNHEREGRFGIDDEPKFWVKRAISLLDGKIKILKMVFHESFRGRVGDITFEFVRSPKKEARILDLVRGHPNFMQGIAVNDSEGNIIRIIDHIPGRTFADYVLELGKNHEDYFFRYFPAVLDEFIQLVQALKFIHDHGEKHGDIRRDHIIRERQTGRCRWIDFDYNYLHRENIFGYDLFGLGNILTYLAGRGDVTVQELKRERPSVFQKIIEDDLNIIFNNRVANMKKVYPYIPDELNLILLHFSLGANVFYEETDQLLDDLLEVREKLD